MAEHTPARVSDATPIGPDVDLAREDVRLADGTRLTDAVADEVVDHVRHTVGGPSLSGKAAQSPQIAFRRGLDRPRRRRLAAERATASCTAGTGRRARRPLLPRGGRRRGGGGDPRHPRALLGERVRVCRSADVPRWGPT